ncbi:MAG: FISUMP domain-containing protein [Paludibacter sp.]|jgi:uncharacterized protein (TIGR02145 family)|nr:FISUMP domain-containing protein [Paludibacter sp.]
MIKRTSLIVFGLITCLLTINALNYTVRFAGKGTSNVVTSVLVQNVSKGTQITLTAGQELNLVDGFSGTKHVRDLSQDGMQLISDRNGSACISFQVIHAGATSIGLFSFDGRILATFNNVLSEGIHQFQLSLPGGLCIVKVSGNGFNYHSKVISRSQSGSSAKISAITTDGHGMYAPAKVMASSAVTMAYAPGDRILFRGYSGTMSTLVSDVITADKTIEFNFVPCADADGNHYTTITIGNQVWMAENLKTTRYADGSSILLRASKEEYMADPDRRTTPIYRYFNDDPSTKDKAGLAYKYQTILHKNVCPEGWHVPDHYEWRTLRDAIASDGTTRFNSIRRTGYENEFWRKEGATNASGFSAIGTGAFWDEWYVHEKTWAIWLANDLFNASSTDNWFFYASTDDNLTSESIVCDEIASSSQDFITAVRCVKNSETSYDVLKLGELPIGLWVTPPAAYQTKDEYKRIKDGGFNFVNGFHYSENVTTRIQQVLNFCSNNGLKFLSNKAVVASDISKYAASPDPGLLTKFIDGIRPYANHPAFAGELLMDEPGKNLFTALAAFTSAFNHSFPDKLAHINLFPTYATGGIQAPSYANYIDSWLQTQQPRHISFDSYPLLSTGGIITDYFYNLDIVRAKSVDKGIPFWTFIQTLSIKGTPGVPDKREPSEVDIRWQVWANLAFGAKGIQYFTYWSPGSGTEQFGEALISQNGQPTLRYGYVQKLNADINRIGKILLQCDAVGVIQTARNRFPMYAALTTFGDLTSVAGDDNLVGCFQSKQGERKLLITTLMPDKNAVVTLNFRNSVTQVRVWENNGCQTVSLVNNKLTLNVMAGEARLVEY